MRIRKIFKGMFLLMIFAVIISGFVDAQVLPSDIEKAFQNGDAELLANYFNQDVKINILNKETDTDISGAKDLMKKFFRENPPVSFESKFESSKANTSFVIATLTTKNKKFRINIFFKNENGTKRIHLLRIENENETVF